MMAGFTDETARRIIAATKKVESSRLFDRELSGSPHAVGSQFFAKITGKSGSKYSWVQVSPNSSGGWDTHPEWASGTTSELWGKEFNNATIATNSIVILEPATNQDYYVFSLTPATSSGGSGSVNTSLICCTSYASQKGDATVSGCATTPLLPKYTVSVPRLNSLNPGTGTTVPYTAVDVFWVGGCVFESDTQYYTDGDIYFWKLTVGSTRDPWDSTLELMHGAGVGSGTASGSVGTPKITSLVYSNPFYWDSLGGTVFRLVTDRNTLPSNVATWMPCKVCVVPPMATYISAPCMTLAANYHGRNLTNQPWPKFIYYEVSGYTGTWVTQTSPSGRLGWAVGDPQNNGSPDYEVWCRIPLSHPYASPTLGNLQSVGTVTFGGTTGGVNIFPCVWCAGNTYNPYYLQYDDGLPVGYNTPFSAAFSTGYYTMHFDECSRGTGGSNYGGGQSMPSLIDPSSKKVDFNVTYQLWINNDPGSPQKNGCTPRSYGGTPSNHRWTFKVHVYEA